jgi:hypothetical protein
MAARRAEPAARSVCHGTRNKQVSLKKDPGRPVVAGGRRGGAEPRRRRGSEHSPRGPYSNIENSVHETEKLELGGAGGR